MRVLNQPYMFRMGGGISGGSGWRRFPKPPAPRPVAEGPGSGWRRFPRKRSKTRVKQIDTVNLRKKIREMEKLDRPPKSKKRRKRVPYLEKRPKTKEEMDLKSAIPRDYASKKEVANLNRRIRNIDYILKRGVKFSKFGILPNKYLLGRHPTNKILTGRGMSNLLREHERILSNIRKSYKETKALRQKLSRTKNFKDASKLKKIYLARLRDLYQQEMRIKRQWIRQGVQIFPDPRKYPARQTHTGRTWGTPEPLKYKIRRIIYPLTRAKRRWIDALDWANLVDEEEEEDKGPLYTDWAETLGKDFYRPNIDGIDWRSAHETLTREGVPTWRDLQLRRMMQNQY